MVARRVKEWSLSSPLALACPVAEPEPLQFGDLTVGSYPDPAEHHPGPAKHYPDPAEHYAAMGIHEVLHRGERRTPLSWLCPGLLMALYGFIICLSLASHSLVSFSSRVP